MAGLTGLEGMQVDIIKPEAGSFGFFNGHGEIVLASGRLHDLGCATDRDSRVPATVLTGFLTTLLNHILADSCEFIAGKKQSTIPAKMITYRFFVLRA